MRTGASAVSKKVPPLSGCHAQAEGAGMFVLFGHMAALRLAMAPDDRDPRKSDNLSGTGTRSTTSREPVPVVWMPVRAGATPLGAVCAWH